MGYSMETELSLDTPLQLSHTNLLYWKSNFPQILSLAQAVTEGSCPKGEARTLGPRAPSGPYIQEVIYMGWVQLSSLVRPKKHGTACVIGPKGEARTLGPRAPWVPKAKLGHSVRVRHL